MMPLALRAGLSTLAMATLVSLSVVASSSPSPAGGSPPGSHPSGSGTITATAPGHDMVELGIHYSVFSAHTIEVRVGAEIRFVIDNQDPIRHEFIVGPDEVHERHQRGTEAAHDPVPGEVSSPVLSTVETTYRFDEPGRYTFACHLPGHVAFGMVGEVVVIA